MRRLRQLLRKRSVRAAEGAVVVEGAELLGVALGAGARVESVFVAAGARTVPAVAAVVEQAFERGARVFDLAPGVLERAADTVTPQPLLAVVGWTPAGEDAVDGTSLVVVCVDVRDPGNAGTIFRSAHAAGADVVVCCEGTVDPGNPKTIRASAGSLFHVPVVTGGSATGWAASLRQRGLATVGTVARGGRDFVDVDWSGPAAVFLGNEASGLSGDVVAALDGTTTVPMADGAESLNVGVAAALVCFEVRRQRRGAGSTGPTIGATTERSGTTEDERDGSGSGPGRGAGRPGETERG